MSDDEEVIYAKRQKTIHYGTLEETMLERIKHLRNDLAEPSIAPSSSSTTTAATGKAEIPEYFDIDNEM